MKNFPHYLIFFKGRACLFNILKQLTRAAGKKILPKFTNILKDLYMNSQQQTKKVTKKNVLQCAFCEPC